MEIPERIDIITQGTIAYSCTTCDNSWDVMGEWERGSFSPDEETDTLCPECGGEGE